jgi:hypothetical protein
MDGRYESINFGGARVSVKTDTLTDVLSFYRNYVPNFQEYPSEQDGTVYEGVVINGSNAAEKIALSTCTDNLGCKEGGSPIYPKIIITIHRPPSSTVTIIKIAAEYPTP